MKKYILYDEDGEFWCLTTCQKNADNIVDHGGSFKFTEISDIKCRCCGKPTIQVYHDEIHDLFECVACMSGTCVDNDKRSVIQKQQSITKGDNCV